MQKAIETLNIIILALFAIVATACSEDERDAMGNDTVAANFSFSVSSESSRNIRMIPNMAQQNGAAFRGIQDVYIVPFKVTRKVQETDVASRVFLNSNVTEYDRTLAHSMFYYFDNCTFLPGVGALLFYGRAIPTGNKAYNGSIVADIPLDMNPSDISFEADPIYPSVVPHTQATSICEYLTYIANTTGWSTTTNSMLKVLYQNFVNIGKTDVAPIAGSAPNVKAYVNALYSTVKSLSFAADSPEKAIQTRILSNIEGYSGVTVSDGKVTSLGSSDEFPASIDLPDGAAVIRWSGTAFIPQTQTTTLASVSAINRYAYPIELYYIGNSEIYTSNTDNRQTSYDNATWDQVLATYENKDHATVSTNTKAVAMKDPVRYAVGCLEITLRSVNSTLYDANNQAVSVTSTAFPLNGVIVSGQHPQKFDFTPKNDIDELFVYDRNMRTSGGSMLYLSNSVALSDPVYTLSLQTNDAEDVKIILEFVNNSGVDFKGVNGMVYRGTKFYLVANISVGDVDESTPDISRRVFTQQHTTKVKMRVEGLSKAYNVVPDILSPRLEVGVQTTPEWTESTPTTVEFN